MTISHDVAKCNLTGSYYCTVVAETKVKQARSVLLDFAITFTAIYWVWNTQLKFPGVCVYQKYLWKALNEEWTSENLEIVEIFFLK